MTAPATSSGTGAGSGAASGAGSTATTRPRPGSDAVTAGVLLVLGLVYGWLSVTEGLGSVERPGAGFFPLLVAIVLVVSAALVLREVRREAGAVVTAAPGLEEEDDLDTEVDEVSWPRVAGVLVAAAAVPVLAETCGFVTTLSVAVAVIGKVMGMPGLLRPVVLGVAFGAVTWLVFVYWLFVPLPVGVLGTV